MIPCCDQVLPTLLPHLCHQGLHPDDIRKIVLPSLERSMLPVPSEKILAMPLASTSIFNTKNYLQMSKCLLLYNMSRKDSGSHPLNYNQPECNNLIVKHTVLLGQTHKSDYVLICSTNSAGKHFACNVK